MKNVMWVVMLVLLQAFGVLAQTWMPYPASQAEVNAGTNAWDYVTPLTLAGSGGGGGSGGTNSVATNLVWQVTPEQFGGRGDLVALNDCTFTNGLTNLYSPTGAFKSTDVGKTGILYNRVAGGGGTPNNYYYTNIIITAIIDSNDVTMSMAAPDTETGTGMLRYGTENTSAFQQIANLVLLTSNAVNQTATIFCSLNGWYLVNGPCIQRTPQESSIVHFPVVGSVSKNQHPSITFDGHTPHFTADTRQGGPSSWSGSGIFTAGYPTNTILLPLGNGCAVFGGCYYTNLNTTSDGAANFSTLNVVFENLGFREAYAEFLTFMNFRWGGGLGVYGCNFDVDYPVGALATWATGQDPYFTGNGNQSVAIYFPDEGNNAWNNLKDSWVFNYWGGVVGAENLKIQNTLITQCKSHALGLGQSPTGAGIFLSDVTLPFNVTNIFVDPNLPFTTNQCCVMAANVNMISSPNGATLSFIADPGGHVNITGILTTNGLPYLQGLGSAVYGVPMLEDFTGITARNQTINSPEYYSLNGVNTSTTAQQEGQTIKSAGWVTNLTFWFYGSVALGSGTNVTLQFRTNGVLETSLQAIVTGGAGTYYVAQDLTDSFYWPGGTNIMYMYSTNNVAQTLVGSAIYTPSWSFQLLKQTP